MHLTQTKTYVSQNQNQEFCYGTLFPSMNGLSLSMHGLSLSMTGLSLSMTGSNLIFKVILIQY